ncbi:MAG TPA: tRNA pseudouridine(38-40) synthase TruA [Polyangium sp.]|nr:tRNA pseudouridine(38-40) synthase TruA [Polyangium sp.]
MNEPADERGEPPLPDGILLTVAYDGRPFSGFAHQPDRRTIAGELLAAVRALDPTIREIRGSSRTDAGVHAFGQRVAFDPSREVPPRGWVLGTARHLPKEIAVRRASLVPRGFTPRFASQGKRYRYLLLRDLMRDPFLEGRVWRVDQLRDDAAITRAAAEASLAVGTHDFAAFRSAADPRENTVRTLRRVSVEVDRDDPRLVRIEVEGDAFMHNMVRILVGTFVDVARERLAPGAVSRALASKRRDDAGITAPPDGLYLVSVTLADEGREAWPSETGV